MRKNEFRKAFTSYDAMLSMLKTHSYEEILDVAASLAGLRPEILEQIPMGGYSKDRTIGAYRFTLLDLLKNIHHYDWLYSRLEDDTSRLVFFSLISYRLLPSQSFLAVACDDRHSQYFDKNIVSCNENEVFVDCGGFTGDTTEEFIRQFGKYKQIYVYEPSQDNIQTCRDNLSKYSNVTVRHSGVGEKSDVLAMDGSSSSNTFMPGKKATDSQGIRIISLDEDIRETITFLKMDIEGFEIPALLGAKRHIRDDFPKLAICTYHIISDMWEIPRLIDEIHPGYRFYIRHYNFHHNWETVVYAIPPKEKQEKVRTGGKRRVVTMPADEGWVNAQLIKDCGLKPYLLYKNHDCEALMVGGKVSSDYSNQQYVTGMQVEFLPDGSLQAKLDYLKEHAEEIDCFMLYGPQPPYIPLVDCYKHYNPSGKVCLNLDANSIWMDGIQWAEPDFCRFMDQCDVITATGHTMQRHLNEKWPWAVEFIPNGFYNFSSTPWTVDFGKKENIILTVGRLGTPQKATDVLLEAFAKIAEQIPDWELHLVGGVEKSFEEWLDGFWMQYPTLKERIRFLGNIADRDELYDTYRRSKIFALPSAWEGGANVIAEALFSGCAVAITKIDEYQDSINSGRCGLASEIGDINGFADILLRLCKNDRLGEICRDAYEYAHEVYDMERVVARLNKLIFGWEA